MDPVFNNYSQKLKNEALAFFESRGKVRFEVLGKKIVGGRVACKSICRIPNIDTIIDPYQGDGGKHINIAYITGYNKAPIDSNKTAVPIFGDIYFYGADGGYIVLNYSNPSDRNMFLYLYFARWGRQNIVEDNKGRAMKKSWHEKPNQYLYELDDPEAKAEALNRMDALVAKAKDMVYSQMANDELIRLFGARYPNEHGKVGLNTIKRNLATLATKEPEYIINAQKNELIQMMGNIKLAEKENFLYFKTSDNTWRWKDGDAIVCKVNPKKDRYETIYLAVKSDNDLKNQLLTYVKTAEEEKAKTGQNPQTQKV